MATLKRPKEVAMGGGRPRRPDDTLKCKKHPKHHQSPGVCSLCLSEKLSLLLSKIQKGRVLVDEEEGSSSSSPSSVSSYYSSSQGSSCSSPMHRLKYVIAMDGKGSSYSLSSFIVSGKNVLTKSRSLAFVQRNKEKRGENGDVDVKKGGFWSKLILRPSRHKTMKEGDLVHSKTTVREIEV